MKELQDKCGVTAVYSWRNENVVPLAINSLLDIQHRGQLSAGLTSYNPQRSRILQTHRGQGTIQEVFSLGDKYKSARFIREYSGSIAIAHNRYATSGEHDSNNSQPFEKIHGRKRKWFAFAFNGNLTNDKELKQVLINKGYHISYDSDTEVIMHYLNRELGSDASVPIPAMFNKIAKLFDGAFSLVFLTAAGDLVAVRDPLGIKPLCYGMRHNGTLVVSSESVSLSNLGIKEIHSLKPGTLLIANDDGITIENYCDEPTTNPSYCYFEWIYFSHLASILESRSVYDVRSKVGQLLAKQEKLDDKSDFIVVPVPDTADTVAQAFAYELNLPLVTGIIRNRYVGRTFIEQENNKRIRLKYMPLRECIEGKKILLIDDTIVRGKTLSYVIDDLRTRGMVKEIHVRIGNPLITSPCFYGIAMPTITELFASKFKQTGTVEPSPELLEKMSQNLGSDSLGYLRHTDLIQAIDFPVNNLCTGCITSNYPTTGGQKLFEKAKNNAQNYYHYLENGHHKKSIAK